MEVLVEEWVDGTAYQVGLATSKAERDQCYRLRFKTFCTGSSPRLNPSDYPDGLETDQYDDHSCHFLAIKTDEPGKAIGTFRLIDCAHGCLIMDNKFADKPFQLPDTFEGEPVRDHTTVEAARWIGPTRGTAKKEVLVKVSTMLLEAGIKVSEREGKKHWICAIDPKPLQNLIRAGWPFRPLIPGPHLYFNDIIELCILSLDNCGDFGYEHTWDSSINGKI